jgi:hypothetical protein
VFKNFLDEFDDAPPEIAWFEWLWLGTLALTALITNMMFDWSASRVGPYGAAFLTSVRFGGSFLLMVLCTRRKSNFARWVIAIPFSLTIVAYDLIRVPHMLERNPVLLFVLLRQVLMFAAIYLLFTPRSRAWFAGRPPLEESPPEDLSFLVDDRPQHPEQPQQPEHSPRLAPETDVAGDNGGGKGPGIQRSLRSGAQRCGRLRNPARAQFTAQRPRASADLSTGPS